MSISSAPFTPLQPATLPLYGSRLIEASAGTGKTWTIAALYIRLILGHGQGTPQGLLPAQILVMTFTRAATLELSERIRDRLTQAARYFRAEHTPDQADAYLDALLQDYPDELSRSHAAWRLESAAQIMDEAAIHTIDAWCQRVLNEFAALTGMLGQETLAPSTADILATAALDYWREHVYPLDAQLLEVVNQCWPTPMDWQAQCARLMMQVPAASSQSMAADTSLPFQTDESIGQDLKSVLTQAAQNYDKARRELAQGWEQKAQKMRDWLDKQTDKTAPTKGDWDGRKLTPKNYSRWLESLQNWAQTPNSELSLTPAAIYRLSPEGMQEARKTPAAWTLPDEFQQLQTLLSSLATLPHPSHVLKQHAIAHTRKRFQELKARAGVFDFSDALNAVEHALNGPHSEALQNRLMARYPVAMIDEFQDTSAQQYRVFSRIYKPQQNLETAALLVIGDPKQSIYRFRGADINSYLRVRQETQGRHYALNVNFRSTHAVVDAVNHCFEPAEARAGSGAFRYRTAADEANNPVPFISVKANGRQEYLATAPHTPMAALQILACYEPLSQTDANQWFANQCAQQVVQWLNEERTGFYTPKDKGIKANDGLEADSHNSDLQFQRLRPADMAILVRTGAEAKLIQEALRARGLPSVYLSDRESVFNSRVAYDLVAWLQAVANPLDVKLVRAALASPLLDLSTAELEAIADDEMELEQHLLNLQALQNTWMKRGILPMLRQTLHLFNLPARWLADTTGGERKLTNYLHLAELLQQAARTIDGEQALIRWLVLQITAAENGQVGDEDSQTVRLESDADLIKIVTIHKSKGLEYPVVFLPFACNYRVANKPDSPPAETEDTSNDISVAPDDEEERLREDLRLLYVALTRARHSLWLGFASIKKGASKSCSTHRSALGYLLAGDVDAPLSAPQWKEILRHWQNNKANLHIQETIATGAKAEPDSIQRFTPRTQTPLLAAERVFTGTPDRSWTISSFSALTRNLLPLRAHETTESNILAVFEPASDIEEAPLWLPPPRGAADEPGDDLAEAPYSTATAEHDLPPAAWHALPKGTRMGNFMHDQLEWLGRDGFSASLNDAQRQRIIQNASRAGWQEHAPAVVQWMQTILATPLPLAHDNAAPSAPAPTQTPVLLSQLSASVSELEFWIPAAQLAPQALDTFCRQWAFQGQNRATLTQRQAHGMLMGFADLVFEANGRYWVLDYKTNYLGASAQAYTPQALEQAMLHHRYDLQAMLYMLALHRLLKTRLGTRYLPEQHLGGALYWFVRGLDAPSAGVLQLPANAAILEQVDVWLTEQQPQPKPNDSDDQNTNSESI